MKKDQDENPAETTSEDGRTMHAQQASAQRPSTQQPASDGEALQLFE